MQKLMRVVIKEELVALTDGFFTALVLNQYLYWLERMKSIDKYIIEEKQRDPDTKIALTQGWIYKTAEELHSELMLEGCMSIRSLRRIIDTLVDKKLLDRRNNPEHLWDKTYQYRPDIRFIASELARLGFHLEGYPRLSDVTQQLPPSDSVSHQSDCVADQSVAAGTAITEITQRVPTEITHTPEAPPLAEFAPEKVVCVGNFKTSEEEIKEYAELNNLGAGWVTSILNGKRNVMFEDWLSTRDIRKTAERDQIQMRLLKYCNVNVTKATLQELNNTLEISEALKATLTKIGANEEQINFHVSDFLKIFSIWRNRHVDGSSGLLSPPTIEELKTGYKTAVNWYRETHPAPTRQPQPEYITGA